MFTRRKKSHAPKPLLPKIEEVPAEIVREIEADFTEEDAAQKREHFEQIVQVSPSAAFQAFVKFVWRENAQLGEEWIQIIQDSKVPGGFEAGMVRQVKGYFGFEEEVVKANPGKSIEFKIREGLPSTYNKSRVLFKGENEDKQTRIIWTVFWTPSSLVADMVCTVLMKGYCNLVLYRLEQKISNKELTEMDPIQVPQHHESPVHDMDPADRDEESNFSTASSISMLSTLKDGEKPSLQWAARLQTGYEGNLTLDQENALKQLRDELQSEDALAWKLCETHPDGPDRIMLRFLRAECTGKQRTFHVGKSKKRLIESLKFRSSWEADKILTNPPPRNEDYLNAAGETVLFDTEGRPVVFTRAGILSTCLDVKLMEDHDWKRNMVWSSELRMQQMRESSVKMGHEVSASVIVYDLKGLGYNFRKIISFSKMMNDVGGPHYPEMVDVAVLMNAPAIFNALWSGMKAFLDPVTTSKVMVFGQGRNDTEKAHRTLRAILESKNLPKEYGGDSDVVVAYPMGYKG